MLTGKVFGGKLDTDTQPYKVGENDYVDAMNITRDSQQQGQDKVVTNIPGNLQVSFILQNGYNKCIGQYADKVRNRIYYFVWNSNGYDFILYYDATLNSIIKVLANLTDSANVDVLGFTSSGKITAVNIIYRDNGDLLFFLDSLGRPSKINVTSFVTGVYNPVLRSYIDVAKPPSQIPIKCTYENTNAISNNNVQNSLFRFSSRWKYADYEKSVYSTQSKTPLPYNPADPTIVQDPTQNARIAAYVETGGPEVKFIEIHGQQAKDGSVSAWFLIVSLDKVALSIPDNTMYRFLFYNDGTYVFDDPVAQVELFDFVPLQANGQELPNGNYLTYAGITEGYDLTGSNATIQTNAVAYDTIYDNTYLFFGYQAPGSNNLTLYLTGAGTNDGSDTPLTIKLNGESLSLYVTAFFGASTSLNFVSTSSSETITTQLASIQAAATAVGWAFVSSTSNSITLSATGMQFGGTYSVKGGGGDLLPFVDLYNYLPACNYPFGIIYYDGDGKTNSVVTQAALNLITAGEEYNANTVQVEIKIYHRPPYWAKTFQIVRAPQQTYGKLTNWVTKGAYQNTINSIQYAYVDISNMALYNQQLQATASGAGLIGYEFQAGDKIKFTARYYNDGTNSVDLVSAGNYDYYILSVERFINYQGQFVYGQFVKISYPTADISSDFNFNGDNNHQNYQILLYNYRGHDSATDIVYNEIGEQYPIGNAGLPNSYHNGNTQSQIPNVQPAIILINAGDNFYRNRNVPVGMQYYIQTSGFEQGSVGTTLNCKLPTGTVTEGNYTLNDTTNETASLSFSSYPQFSDTSPNIQNTSSQTLYFRVQGTFAIGANENGDEITLYAKIVNTGGSTGFIQVLVPTQGALVVGTQYTFAFDVSFGMPAGSKMWFVNIAKGNIFIGGSQITLTALLTITIPIIEPTFTDVYPIVENSNGRPLVLNTNARQIYYPTKVRFSQAYQDDTSINGTNTFYAADFDEYDRGFGSVQKLFINKRYLYVFQQFNIGIVPVLTQIVKDVEGNPLEANSDILLNKITYPYEQQFGISNAPSSFAFAKGAMYGVDINRGIVWRLSQDGLIAISILYKNNAFFVGNLAAFNSNLNNGYGAAGQPYLGDPSVCGCFNEFTNKYIVALEAINRYDSNGNLIFSQAPYTLSFLESRDESEGFESKLSYYPEMMSVLNNLFVSFNNGNLWLHNNPVYNNFYGVQYGSYITASFNGNIAEKKQWISLTELSNVIWECTITTQAFSYGNTNQQSVIKAAWFKQLESQFSAPFLRDINSQRGLVNGNYLKGSYIIIKFAAVGASGYVYLAGVTVKYIDSPLTTK